MRTEFLVGGRWVRRDDARVERAVRGRGTVRVRTVESYVTEPADKKRGEMVEVYTLTRRYARRLLRML